MTEGALRIGEVADRVGVTTRTIRYYEERGLLGAESDRAKGAHRLYDEADVVRLQELIRLRDLLGLTLEELVELAEAEEARAALRGQWEESASDEERARIVEEAIPLVERQLELKRRYLECFEPYDDPYDVLLDEYEQGLTTAEAEHVLEHLKRELVPLVAAVRDAGADDGDRLVSQGALGERRAREPVDRVLQAARDRGVVLGGGEEDGVRA